MDARTSGTLATLESATRIASLPEDCNADLLVVASDDRVVDAGRP